MYIVLLQDGRYRLKNEDALSHTEDSASGSNWEKEKHQYIQ